MPAPQLITSLPASIHCCLSQGLPHGLLQLSELWLDRIGPAAAKPQGLARCIQDGVGTGLPVI